MHYAPWTFCILTFGCKVNQYESQSVREAWQRMNGMETDAPAEADVILLNTCAVTANAVTDARQAVRRLQREAPGVPSLSPGAPPKWPGKQLAALLGVLRVVEQDHKSRLLDAPPLVLFVEEAAGSATPVPFLPRRSRRSRRHARPYVPAVPYRRIPPGPSRTQGAGRLLARVRLLHCPLDARPGPEPPSEGLPCRNAPPA